MALSDELNRLAELRAAGTLTEDEFRRAKERILNNAQSSPEGEAIRSNLNTFRRSRYDRWFGGVCGGIARATGVESWVWRLIFTVLFVCAGAGLLLYVLLWIFVPTD